MDADTRCTVQARTAGLQPAGTAGAYDAFLLVEVPLPWPREITEHAALADLVVPERTRVQGVVPAPDNVADGESLVVLHRRPPGPFRGYERVERRVLLAAVAAGCDGLRDAPPADDDAADLLVCTHGSRDRCCGSLGMSLFLSVPSRPRLRVRRTSHTGGHRFAPTAILLPEGTCWGWLDDELLGAVVARSRPPADLLGHYRGSTGIDGAPAQVAEAAVFADVGWEWLDDGREATVVDEQGDRTVVRVTGAGSSWEVVVHDRGPAPQPVCGEPPPPPEGKADRQLTVVEVAPDR